MSRRGLVSKNLGGPSSSNAALMAKGDKPAGKPNLTIESVAQKLKVSPQQVREWLDSDMLRGTESAGVKAYDFETFRLKPDNQAEIQKAQTKNRQEGKKSGARKPEKTGFFSKFRSIIFKSDSPPPSGGKSLQKENKELKEKLKKLQSKGSAKSKQTSDLEEKVRYLEQKLGKVTALEDQISDLKIQLAGSSSAETSSPGHSAELENELQATREKLQLAEQLIDQKKLEIENLQSLPAPPPSSDAGASEELEQLKSALLEAQATIRSSDEEAQRYQQEIAELSESLVQAKSAQVESMTVPLASSQDEALLDELLSLQSANLKRFQHLSRLHGELKEKFGEAQATSGQDPEEAAKFEKLKTEFKTLRRKHKRLLETQNESEPGHRELVEQLAAARVAVTKLKQESTHLKARLSDSEVSKWKAKSEEFERQLARATKEGASPATGSNEVKVLKKAVQSKENQLQNMTSRLRENEKALDKAMEESTRLTALLIERENRLREVSGDYEREYQQKIENLDRQVSGLQWKLSLREERIAQLESELVKNSK